MKLLASTSLVFLLSAAAGCGEEEAPPAPPAAAAPADGAAAPAADGGGGRKGGPKANAEPPGLPPLPVADIQERDFLESPTNRDPFRNFADLFVVKPAVAEVNKVQRDVLIPKYALGELKVVGIVTGTAGRVLVTDPTGLGWVLRVGDFVGRSESVRSGGTGGGETAVNWRLDRIRQNDVVFVRETPDPSAPSTTRVLSLRSQDELRQEIRTGIRGTRPDEESGEKEEPAPKRSKSAPRGE